MQLKDVVVCTRRGPLSREVRARELRHLVVPNGAGRRTLLAVLGGLPSGKGSIRFGGERLEEWATGRLDKDRGYVVQQQNALLAMTVWH